MRILLIAYYFPPVMGGGTMRAAKFAEHLPGRGHEVLVATHTYGATRREGSVLRVHDPSFNRQRSGVGRWHWLLRRLWVEARNRSGSAVSIYTGWRRRVELEEGTIAEFAPQAVLATYSPVEDLELGLHFAERFAIPLISDFRDGLLYEPIEERRLAGYAPIRRHYADVERETARASAVLTCALPRVACYLERTYPGCRAVPLPNAFDPADFSGLSTAGFPDGTFNIVHTGAFAHSDITCDIAPFVRALTSLLERNRELGDRLRFHQFGRLTGRERGLLAPLVGRGIVVDHGPCERTTCLAHQRGADLLFFITSLQRPSVTPAKVLEYLGAGRPILGLTESTFAAEILDRTEAGLSVHPGDERAIATALDGLIAGRLKPEASPGKIDEFTMAAQIAGLDAVIRSL